MSCADGIRRCPSWLYFDGTVAMIEEIPALATVGFDPAATFVQQCMVRTTLQHKVGQRRFAAIGTVRNVMPVDVTTVRATRETARAVPQP